MEILIVGDDDEEILMDSMERWCSSNAPWRARTPITILSLDIMDVGLLMISYCINLAYDIRKYKTCCFSATKSTKPKYLK